MVDTTVPPILQRALDAINAADTEAFVTAFADDGLIDDWGRVLRGPDGVRQWAATDAIGAGALIDVFKASTEGNVTEIRFQWSSRVFTGTSSAFVTIENGRIASFRIPPSA